MVSEEQLYEVSEECTVSSLTRRTVLQMGAGLAAAGALPCAANAAPGQRSGWRTHVERPLPEIDRPQRLYIKNDRTGDVFNDIVKQGPLVFEDAYADLDHLMRDWRREETISMDRGLIDLLLTVQSEIGHDQPITLISGYRSRSTNEMLRRRIRKVAKNSYHMKGMAVDMRIKGVSTGAIRQIALHQRAGGVGYYPSKGFIHLDTGPVRTWRG